MLKRYACLLVLALAANGTWAAEAKKKKPRGAAKAAAVASAGTTVAAAGAVKGRDWTQIDTNKDGYISPDEMDTWLKANPGPQK